MSSDWEEYRFGELCDISRGASPRPINEFMSDTGMPWVKIADATASDSKFIERTKERIKLDGVSKSVKVFPGDLILTNSATPGLPRFMSIEACIHDGWMLLRNFRGLDKEFAFWLLMHERKNLVAQGNGSVFTNLKTDILRNHTVSIPSLEQQSVIAKILNSLSDKIQLNQQINQTLEQMAQAIFKSWFVDFEPVKAKMAALEAGGSEDDALLAAMQAIAGSALFATDAADADAQTQLARLQAEHPEQYTTLRATAELFPSAMQESELGEIPEGWEVTLSGRVIDVRDGTHDSPKRAEEGFPLVTSKHITSGELKIEDAYLISKLDFDSVNKRSKVDDGDILLTMIGTVGIPFYVNQADVEFAIKNVGLFKTSSNRNLGAFFYLLLKSEKMQSYLDARIAGTTQKYLSLTTLRTLEFVLPHEQVLHYFSTLTAPIFNQIEQLIQQNTYLSNTRDTLLPKLLSGELSLAAAEEQLADTVEPADV